jgi:hypothetical protein
VGCGVAGAILHTPPLADTPRLVGIVHDIVSLALPDFGSREPDFASYTETGYSNPFDVPRKQSLSESGTVLAF